MSRRDGVRATLVYVFLILGLIKSYMCVMSRLYTLLFSHNTDSPMETV